MALLDMDCPICYQTAQTKTVLMDIYGNFGYICLECGALHNGAHLITNTAKH